jgi:chorismate synthase
VRVAVGAIAKQLLAQFGIAALGYVVELGGTKIDAQPGTIDAHRKLRDESIIYSLNPSQDEAFRQMIDACGKDGDTLGGIVEVRAEGLPFGLGTHTQWDRKLDGRLAQAVMSIQAIKGVEIGLGFEAARRRGSHVHDPIQFDKSQQNTPNLGFVRPTNNAGGLEAGMTNGQPLVVRAAKKPISTLRKPLESVNLKTHQPEVAQYERSDVCAVSAASVIVENVVAFEVAAALVDKFGGDSLAEMKARYDLFLKMARERQAVCGKR